MSDRDDEIRRRQRSRSVVMALALAAFVVLMYLSTIARMSGG
jgi:predicted nucleic acid-binding Zn ribbon protein